MKRKSVNSYLSHGGDRVWQWKEPESVCQETVN